MSKRAQVAVFIVLGIIVIAAIAFALYLRGQVAKPAAVPAEVAPPDIAPVQKFVEECAQKTAKDAVVYTGLRGGVAPVYSDKYIFFIGIPVQYHFVNATMIPVTENITQNTLQYYMDSSLKSCTNNFEDFQGRGYNISEGNVTSKAIIGNSQVIFDISYPLDITVAGKQQKLSKFTANVQVNLPKMIGAVNQYLQSQNENPSAFRTGTLMDIASANNLQFEVFNRGQGNVVISMIDNSTQINNNPFILAFAVNYNWTG